MEQRTEPADPKKLSQAQFGANAANYATSEVHAKGASLDRMVELADPQAEWCGLDIATAAGHTALVFAPHVATMVATDLTAEMVSLTDHRAAELDQLNVLTAQADAERLPFVDCSFDLVTCRIAPHHFPDPQAFVAEAARVLRPAGVFVVVDNIVPEDADAARWYNDWERRRDPSHVRCLGLAEWGALVEATGLRVEVVETAPKRMRFESWVDTMSVPSDARPALLGDLLSADSAVREFLEPTGSDQASAEFVLTEALLTARAPDATGS